jgi:Fur family ferric uptake transcriptional regulator
MRSRAQQHPNAPRPEPRSADELATMLRAAGLRRTGPRVAVLASLARASSPLSHAEICEQLGELALDRATIYRNLIDLTDAGLVARTDLGDHVWRFELRADEGAHAQKHPHLVCTRCGEVSCLDDVKVEVKVLRGARRAIDTNALEVQLKGLCEHCAA